jgi:hypothetical protein
MALAERSKEDVDRLAKNTLAYRETVDARNKVPLLQGEALEQMIEAASKSLARMSSGGHGA